MHNRILSLLMALILVFALAVNTSAVDDAVIMPDLTEKGSLTFVMDVNGVKLDSGNLNMYYVATVEKVTEKQYDFRLLDALTAVGATLDTDDLYDSVQAQQLLAHAHKALEQYLTLPIKDGQVRFDGLDAGLYLVWQRPEDASDGYDAMLPFLISVPKWQNGMYVLNVDADPKVPLETEPTEPPPPPPPPPPELPKTGQLNWPVPVMAVAGVILIFVGWLSCLRRKRSENEE